MEDVLLSLLLLFLIDSYFILRKPLPAFDSCCHHVNELDRLKRQVREKDLGDAIRKLESLKEHKKSTQEIIETLEDVQQNLELMQADVIIISFVHCFIYVHI